MIIRNSN